MRRRLQRIWREHHHEIDRQALPFDFAQVVDLGFDIATQHVDRDDIAEG